MAEIDGQRRLNQLEMLCEAVGMHPDLTIPGVTSEFIERLVQQDLWALHRPVPLSAMNGNNPSLPIRENTYEPHQESIWRAKLELHRPRIERAIPCVGRLETTRAGRERVAGTGWLVRSDIVVTNRHVAAAAASALPNDPMRLRIDFLEEDGREDDDGTDAWSELRIEEVLYLAPEDALDLAFLRIEDHAAALQGAVIELGDDVEIGMDVCTIGYPTTRDTLYDPGYFFQMFGDMLGVKRLSPGTILGVSPQRIDHDCATLGGSSGSVILDMNSGRAVALNYGEDGPINFGVPARIVRERLERIARP